MRTFAFVALFLSLAFGRKVVGQRDAISDKEYYIPLIDWKIIDSIRPSESVEVEVPRILAGEPTRLVMRFDVDSIADFWPENPVYSAYLEMDIASSKNLEISIEKPVLGANLHNLTWDCATDSDLDDAVSICADKSGKFPGLATVSFDHVFDVRKSDAGRKRFDITALVRSGPGAVLVRLLDEKRFSNQRANDHVRVNVDTFTPRIVIAQPKANIILSDSEKHPGSREKFVTTEFRGQSITHHMFFWAAKNPYPESECNIVIPFGVYFTAGVGYGQGEIMNDRCNVYMISQHCTGLTSCVYGGWNTMEVRAQIFGDLLWWSPTGLRLPSGTHFIAQDQGSSLVTHTIGFLDAVNMYFDDNGLSYVGSHIDYNGWTTGFYCEPSLWAQGLCSRAFFPRPGMLFPSGFLQFALCSQHGPQNSTDTEQYCRARMHELWEYWAGWGFSNPWDGSIAEADLRAKFPWLSNTDFDPAQVGAFAWFGYETLVGPVQFVPGELEYHNSWTKSTRANYLEQRHAMSLYPDQLIVPVEYPECGPSSTLNPSCNPFVDITFDINTYLSEPIGTTGPQRTQLYETLYSQRLLNLTGAPFDMRFMFVIKPGLGDDIDFNPANGVQCRPDNNGVLLVNGSCTGYGGSCVCGHDLLGNLGLNASPENIAARLANMPTAHDISKIASPLLCHQDLRCTDNYMHYARVIENVHGIRVREHQRLSNGW